MRKYVASGLLVVLSQLCAVAAPLVHGTSIREVTLRVAPGTASEKLIRVERGRDLVILERTNIKNQLWLKVYVSIAQEGRATREITGWISAPGVVTSSTPNADQIVFGEAVDSENQAEQRGGRKGAAQDAMRLYSRLAEMFPNSPLAGESLWRAADIRWQLDKFDVLSRPSAREMRPDVRPAIDDHWMQDVQKKFPHSKWADLAAYDLIDNKLCGEWKGLAKCPEAESGIYEHYAREHPQSPKAAEALYNAAWRQAALVDIYRINNESARSAAARERAIALLRQIVARQMEGDWKPRAAALIFKLEQNMPVYGSSEE